MRLAEKIRLAQRGLLTMAVEEVEELRLKRGARAVGVEVAQKRVLHFLQHDCGVESSAEALRECGLARANRSFNRDVAELQGAR